MSLYLPRYRWENQFDDGILNRDEYDNSFADAAPVLLANSSSLAQLNEWLGDSPEGALGRHHHHRVSMDRFRPNLVITSLASAPPLPPWAEDEWLGKEIRIGQARFLVASL